MGSTATAGGATAERAPQAVAGISGRYELDPSHTRIGFAARHAMVTMVRGQFLDFRAVARLDGEHPHRSTAEVTIAVASLDTGQEQRDAHLRSPDFLDVESFPVITFRSTAVIPVGDARYRLTGDLTIRDVTRSLDVEMTYNGSVTDASGTTRVGLEGSAQIDRRDYGLLWNVALEGGGLLVAAEVRLEFDISAVKVAGPTVVPVAAGSRP